MHFPQLHFGHKTHTKASVLIDRLTTWFVTFISRVSMAMWGGGTAENQFLRVPGNSRIVIEEEGEAGSDHEPIKMSPHGPRRPATVSASFEQTENGELLLWGWECPWAAYRKSMDLLISLQTKPTNLHIRLSFASQSTRCYSIQTFYYYGNVSRSYKML